MDRSLLVLRICAPTHPNELRRRRSASFSVAVNLTGDSIVGAVLRDLADGRSHLAARSRSRARSSPSPTGSGSVSTTRLRDEWNRAIIDEAAMLVARSLEELRDVVGDEALVALLKAALELRQRAREKRSTRASLRGGTTWREHLATADVVPTEADRYRSPQTALLWGGHDAEANAGAVLAELGLDLVAASVRAEWFLFRESIVIRQLESRTCCPGAHTCRSNRAGRLGERLPTQRRWRISGDCSITSCRPRGAPR